MKEKGLIAVLLLILISSISNGQNHSMKPDYVGHIEYTKGNFGTYNYPIKGDSVIVYIKDSTIDFIILSIEGNNPRNLEISSSDLKQVQRKEYDDIITEDKIIPSGSFDLKYTAENSGRYSRCTVYLTHYGDGTTADLTLIGESGGIRLNDIFTAQLVKFK